jgi:hypothetical protein
MTPATSPTDTTSVWFTSQNLCVAAVSVQLFVMPVAVWPQLIITAPRTCLYNEHVRDWFLTLFTTTVSIEAIVFPRCVTPGRIKIGMHYMAGICTVRGDAVIMHACLLFQSLIIGCCKQVTTSVYIDSISLFYIHLYSLPSIIHARPSINNQVSAYHLGTRTM